jgi:hypothetical protein
MGFFSALFGDSLLDKFNEKIDLISDKISTQIPLSTNEGNISGVFDELFQDDKEQLDTLFSGVTVSSDRLERYAVYEDAYRSTSLIKRIFKVYRSNLLQKNPVTGDFIVYLKTSDVIEQAEFSTAKRICQKIVTYFDLLKKLKYQIAPTHFLYGDCYVEALDISQKSRDDVYKKVTTINEITIQNKNERELLNLLEQSLFILESVPTKNIITEQDYQKNDSGIQLDLTNVVYYIHSPKNIIKLVTKYGTCIGFLEVSNVSSTSDRLPTSAQISSIISKLSTLSSKSCEENEKLIDKIFSRFLMKLLVNDKYHDPKSVVEALDDNVFKFIRKCVYEHRPHSKGKYSSVNIRFIPVNNMVEFQTPSSEYFPYGESLVDPLVLPSKLYLISQLSNIVIKLSRASLIRKWIIDAGPYRQHMGLIQKIRRELYNTRVTLNNISNYKSLVNLLSDFKDMYIISKEGRRPVDVEVSSHGDPTIKVADLEDARRELLLLSGVPPQYVGYDVVELREQLIQTNIIFANEIIDMQESYNSAIRKLLDITAKIVGYNERDRISEVISVTLIPPVAFIAQAIELTLGTVGNIANALQNFQVNVDPYFFLEKYVPYIDWEEYRQKADQYKRKTSVQHGGSAQQPGGY